MRTYMITAQQARLQTERSRALEMTNIAILDDVLLGYQVYRTKSRDFNETVDQVLISW